jgi:hypothetical protein
MEITDGAPRHYSSDKHRLPVLELLNNLHMGAMNRVGIVVVPVRQAT